jgi:putative phosphoribosyl transferase
MSDPNARSGPGGQFPEQEVVVSAGPVQLGGNLVVPPNATGIVLFAHGSGSGRFSPRNRYVAQVLNRAGLATLLLDLLTEQESYNRQLVFDIPFLADRLRVATAWVQRESSTASLPIGYFGASTGAGAAIVAAAREGKKIQAIVSRGGRPDLADGALGLITAPTLLIVGGNDQPVITMNQQAFDQIRAPKDLVIVPGATHLFEEPGTLEEVARLASAWFVQYLQKQAKGQVRRS